MSGFDIAAVLDEAWSLTKRQYWHWLLVIFVAIAIPVAIIIVGALAASRCSSPGCNCNLPRDPWLLLHIPWTLTQRL